MTVRPIPVRETPMRRLSCLILTVVTLSATAALAQDNAPDPRKACRSSALQLCRHEAMSGDRAGVRACLIKNFDKVSPDCQTAMKAMAAKMRADGAPDAPAPSPKP